MHQHMNLFAEGDWVRTWSGEYGFIYEVHQQGYNVHVPQRDKALKNRLESYFYRESRLQALTEEICEDARKAFVDWALDERRFDLLEG